MPLYRPKCAIWREMVPPVGGVRRILALATLLTSGVQVRPLILSACYAATISLASAAGPSPATTVHVEPIDVPGLDRSLTGLVAGRIGSATVRVLVVAGGPEGADWIELTGDGNAKLGARWDRNGTINLPRWSAAAEIDGSLVVAGGMSAAGPVATVSRLRWADGGLATEELPPLPQPLAAAAAVAVTRTKSALAWQTVIEKRVYVVGGLDEQGSPQRTLYQLDLLNLDAGWTRLEDMPEDGLVAPLAAWQGEALVLVGGWEFAAAPAGTYRWSRRAASFLPRPREGATRAGWHYGTPMPADAPGSSLMTMGQGHLALLGAGGALSPSDLPIAVEVGRAEPIPFMTYNVFTDAWTQLPSSAALKDVGRVLPGGNTVLLSRAGAGSAGRPKLEVARIRTERELKGLRVWDWAVVAGYFVSMALLGIRFSRRQTSGEQYALAGRRIKWWAAGLSMFATGASAISLMAIPATTFRTNLVWWFPVLTGFFTYFIQSRLIFPLLRRLELTSTFEYLERRFNPALRWIAGLQSIAFQSIAVVPVVLLLPSLMLSATTGLDVRWSVVILGVVTIIYTAQGGYEAVIWTDVAQGILMLVTPVIMLVLIVDALPGGAREFLAIGNRYDKFKFAVPDLNFALPSIWILCLGTILQTTVMQAGQQAVIQRVFSTPIAQVRKTAGMMTFCSIAIATLVNLMGVGIFVYFHAFPHLIDPTSSNDQVVPLFVVVALPVGLAGLALAAIYAASMSTISSAVNSTATVMAEDFYRRLFPGASDRKRLRMMKTGSYVVGLVGVTMALLLARVGNEGIFPLWIKFGGLLGGGISGVYSLGMFSRRANGVGAICGAIGSIIVGLILELFTDVHWFAYTPISLLVCVALGYTVSVLTGAPKKDLAGLTVFTARSRTQSAVRPVQEAIL